MYVVPYQSTSKGYQPAISFASTYIQLWRCSTKNIPTTLKHRERGGERERKETEREEKKGSKLIPSNLLITVAAAQAGTKLSNLASIPSPYLSTKLLYLPVRRKYNSSIRSTGLDTHQQSAHLNPAISTMAEVHEYRIIRTSYTIRDGFSLEVVAPGTANSLVAATAGCHRRRRRFAFDRSGFCECHQSGTEAERFNY